jgi:hypothetical protein
VTRAILPSAQLCGLAQRHNRWRAYARRVDPAVAVGLIATIATLVIWFLYTHFDE